MTTRSDITSFNNCVARNLALNANAKLICARRPVLVRVGHKPGRDAPGRAQNRIAVWIGDWEGRCRDGAGNLNIHELRSSRDVGGAIGGYGIGSVGTDKTTSSSKNWRVHDAPSAAKYRLGVDLIRHANARPNRVGIGWLVEIAIAGAGE